MKVLKVLVYGMLGFLFACLFIFFGISIIYLGENNSHDYYTPTIVMNVGTGDRSVNQLPTLETISLSFPQYGGSNVNINGSISDCSQVRNIVIKVTAINPVDIDGNISRMKFYYYDVDDPDTILEYKENWTFSPYAYFMLPKMEKEYRFGVILYDNNGGVVDSEDIIGKGPVIYIPASCREYIPITLKVDSTDIKVGDTVTFNVISEPGNNDFVESIYYDFDGDGELDLVTQDDTVTYTFTEPHEEGIIPSVTVNYKGNYKQKFGEAKGETIYVNNEN